MGYDMSYENIPAAEASALVSLYKQLANAEGSQTRREIYAEVDRVRTSYARFNIWGMQRVRQGLMWLKMVDTEYEHSPWPKPYNEEQAEMIIKEYDRKTKLPPVYKFCSNDNWLVTPEEVRTALAAYDSFPVAGRRRNLDSATEGNKEMLKAIEEFVEWMRGSIPHGGFRVS